MATTLLRLGLWLVILVLALYVFVITFPEAPFVPYLPMWALGQALAVAAALVVASFIARVLGKGAKVVTKNRCRVCRTPIATGAMYCREHLRSILSDEDDRVHQTRTRH